MKAYLCPYESCLLNHALIMSYLDLKLRNISSGSTTSIPVYVLYVNYVLSAAQHIILFKIYIIL